MLNPYLKTDLKRFPEQIGIQYSYSSGAYRLKLTVTDFDTVIGEYYYNTEEERDNDANELQLMFEAETI